MIPGKTLDFSLAITYNDKNFMARAGGGVHQGMQVTVYFNRDKARDRQLLEQLEEKAREERRSKSATILVILEEYFDLRPPEGEGEDDDPGGQ